MRYVRALQVVAVRHEDQVAPGWLRLGQHGRKARQPVPLARVIRIAVGFQIGRDLDAAEGQRRRIDAAAIGAGQHRADRNAKRLERRADAPRQLAPRLGQVALVGAARQIVVRLSGADGQAVAEIDDQAAGPQCGEGRAVERGPGRPGQPDRRRRAEQR